MYNHLCIYTNNNHKVIIIISNSILNIRIKQLIKVVNNNMKVLNCNSRTTELVLCPLSVELKAFVVPRFRTPIRWLKFRPENPMGEIVEEGDRNNENGMAYKEGEEGTGLMTSEKNESTVEMAAVKEVGR